jgi:hypothetical protein
MVEISRRAKELWALGGFMEQPVARHSAGIKSLSAVKRDYGQTAEVEVYANQRLNLAKQGRSMEEMPRLQTGPGKSGSPAL